MDILGKLFGGSDKVKVMRLFLTNPDLILVVKEIARRSKIQLIAAHRELTLLRHLEFINPKRGEKTPTGKKLNGWQLNPLFPFLYHLRNLLRADILNRQREITDRFAHCGKIKLLIVAGLFSNRRQPH